MRCGWRGRSWIRLSFRDGRIARCVSRCNRLRHESPVLLDVPGRGEPAHRVARASPHPAALRAPRSPPPSASALRRCRSARCAPASTWPARGSARRTAAASVRKCPPSTPARASRSPCFNSVCTEAKALGLDMRRQQDRAVGAVGERVVILRVLAGQHAKAGGRRRSKSIDCARSAPQSFMPTMFGCSASCSSVSLVRLTRGAVGDVVEHDRPRGVVGERGEMLHQAALRRPRLIGARDQIAVDRPGRRLIQRIQHLRGAGARQARGRSAGSARCRRARRASPSTSRSSSAMPSVMPSPEVAARINPSTGPLA